MSANDINERCQGVPQGYETNFRTNTSQGDAHHSGLPFHPPQTEFKTYRMVRILNLTI